MRRLIVAVVAVVAAGLRGGGEGDDRNDGDWLNSLEDLGKSWIEQVEHHFTHYKDLKKPGSTKVLGWGDAEEAKRIIGECIERYQQQ